MFVSVCESMGVCMFVSVGVYESVSMCMFISVAVCECRYL